MNSKDIAQKTLEAYNDVFSDIVNVLLFNGEDRVKESELSDALPRSILKIDGRLHEQERDAAKYWKNNRINLAFYGLENQTEPDKLMPFRVISYDGAEYGKQANKENRREPNYPVITMVLYLGYKGSWRYPRTLYESLNIDEELKRYVSDYRINVFEIAYMEKEQIERFQSDFRILADYLYQMRVNKDYEPSSEITIKHVNELLQLMSAMTGDKRFEETVNEEYGREVTNMCEVLDRVEARGIKRGREEGIRQGREEGIKQGREEGISLGIRQGKQEGISLGADRISRLNELLAREGDLDKILRANTDKEYQRKLLEEYHL